jgi:excisionase family DNA binding protein
VNLGRLGDVEARVVLHDFETTLRSVVQDVVEVQLAGRDAGTRWLDVEGAAAYLGNTTPDAIRAMVKRGQIPVHRTPTGRLLFDRRELDAWVRSEAA